MGTLAAGIKEIFATSKNTGSNVMLCGNDGTPDGHMTMAKLVETLGGLNGSFKGNFGGDDWIKIVDLTYGMGAMLINSMSFSNQSPTTFSLSYYNFGGSYFISPKLVSGAWNKNDDNPYMFDIRYKYESGRLRVWIKDHSQGGANISYCGAAPSWVQESIPTGTIHPSVDDVDLLSFNDIAQNTSNLTRLANSLGVQIESFSGNSHYGYTFPTSDGFAIKLAINANSFVLFCLGNDGKFYYKYIWQGIDDVNWQLINVVQQ